jgi:hypothetical protein
MGDGATARKKPGIGSKMNAGSFRAKDGFALNATSTSCKTSRKLEESRVRKNHRTMICTSAFRYNSSAEGRLAIAFSG